MLQKPTLLTRIVTYIKARVIQGRSMSRDCHYEQRYVTTFILYDSKIPYESNLQKYHHIDGQ